MLERLAATRIVSTPEALNAVVPADGVIMLRTAADEALLIGATSVAVDDPDAIVVTDTGWCGAWLDGDAAEEFLRHSCAWPRPTARPAFAQGMIAQLPVKLWFEESRTLFVVSHVFGEELADRMGLDA